MFDPVTVVVNQFQTFTLVAFRLMGVTMFAPMLGAKAIPGSIRALLGLALAVVVFPAVPAAAAELPRDMIGYTVAVAGELAVGVTVGLLLLLIFVGVQIGGQMVGQQMGLAMAQLYNPGTESNSSLMSQMYYWMALMVFVCLGWHVHVVGSLAASFQSVPLLGVALGQNVFELFMGVMEQVLTIAVRVAAPAVTAMMLVSVALGFIARTVPQLNILVVGFPLRLALGYLVVAASLVSGAYLFEDMLTVGVSAVQAAIRVFSPAG